MNCRDSPMTCVQSLHIYPIKSCAAIDLKSAKLDNRGFVNDRRFMVISSSLGFLTQRKFPQLATVKTSFKKHQLIIKAKGMSGVSISAARSDAAPLRLVKIWNDEVFAYDQGDDVAQWFQDFLGRKDVRLVRISDQGKRPFASKNGAPGGEVAFVDSRPLLIISKASLEDLNSRLDSPLLMNRFRPNIVVNGLEPYEEDKYRNVKIGSTNLFAAKKCTRCIITTIDQSTGQRKGNEPLTTLNKYRKTDVGVVFGNYFVHEKPGIINVGDEIHFY